MRTAFGDYAVTCWARARPPFRHWIMRIARNHCLDVLRRRRRASRLFAAPEEREPADPGCGPLTQLLCSERREAVRTAVERLPEGYRVPVILRYYEDLTYDEIAETLSLTRQGVATLLFRAKKKLRQSLGGETMGGSHAMRL
jgi:RNA polymerase sigma-70 factor (ECF subfamily)